MINIKKQLGRAIKKSEITNRLMLVDDPVLLIKTMCDLKNSLIYIDDFKKQLEINLNRIKPIHKKTVHTYFYTATTYNLLKKEKKISNKQLYRISSVGEYLCDIYNKENKKRDYQQSLKKILLNNEKKGIIFRNFLEFVSISRSIYEIYTTFEEPTGKTLIAWTLEAGLIRRKNDYVIKTSKKVITKNKITVDIFEKVLINTYKEMQKTDMFGIKKIYVDINEIRQRVIVELDLDKEYDFDDLLTKLLENQHEKIITLDGGPPFLYDDKYQFTYKSKKYLYLSIN